MGEDKAVPMLTVDPGSIGPYVSILVLEPVDHDTESAFSALRDLVRSPTTRRTRRSASLVAEGFETPVDVDGLTEVVPFVHRVLSPPSWQIGIHGFRNESHALSIAVRSEDLIAVMVDRIWADRLQSWLDQPGRPIRRVPSDTLRVLFSGARPKDCGCAATTRRGRTRPTRNPTRARAWS